MISHFPSCIGDSPIPQPGTLTPESDSGVPSAKDGGDFFSAIFRVLNPASAASSPPRSLPKNGALLSSNQLVQGKALSPAPSDDATQLPAEIRCPAPVIAVAVQPKAVRPSSERPATALPAKTGNNNQDALDAAATTNIVASLIPPAVPVAIPDAPATSVAMPEVTSATPARTNPISILAVAAQEFEGAKKPGAGTSVPKAQAPVPFAPVTEKTASPLGSVEPTGNDAPRSPTPASLDPPAKAPPLPQAAPDSSAQVSPPPQNTNPNQGLAVAAGLQPIDIQNETTQTAAQGPDLEANGIGAALSDQRMKFAGQMNESAGRTVQKLPRTSATRDGQMVLDAVNGTKPNSSSISHKDDVASLPSPIQFSAETNSSGLQSSGTSLFDTSNAAGQLAGRVEHVARLVAQEAAMVRQSGSTSLAVSVKVDPHTELFVQLTNHDGQIQASLRFERGSVAGLDGHWGQLQDSLARQNIQLLPLQDKNFSRQSSSGANADAGESQNFGKSSQNQQPPVRDNLTGLVPAAVGSAPARSRRSGGKNAVRQGWETWA